MNWYTKFLRFYFMKKLILPPALFCLIAIAFTSCAAVSAASNSPAPEATVINSEKFTFSAPPEYTIDANEDYTEIKLLKNDIIYWVIEQRPAIDEQAANKLRKHDFSDYADFLDTIGADPRWRDGGCLASNGNYGDFNFSYSAPNEFNVPVGMIYYFYFTSDNSVVSLLGRINPADSSETELLASGLTIK